jgi:hypothetical protein
MPRDRPVDVVPPHEEQLGRLLGTLPPAPEGWVAAAAELPRARRALAGIEAELAGELGRPTATARLERALAEAGHEPTPALVRAVRRGLGRTAD